MIRIEQIGSVRKISIARTILSRNLYFTAAYLVDGLMVDTGCAHPVRELIRALDGSYVHLIANTHSHEDHIGANAALQTAFDAQIFAHREALPYLADPKRRRLSPGIQEGGGEVLRHSVRQENSGHLLRGADHDQAGGNYMDWPAHPTGH